MSGQLEQLLGYLERDGVTEVVFGTGKPIAWRNAKGLTNITARPLSGEQLNTIVRGSEIAALIPESDGDVDPVQVQVGRRKAMARIARRGEVVYVSLTRVEVAPAEPAKPAASAAAPVAVEDPPSEGRSRTKTAFKASGRSKSQTSSRAKSPTNAPRSKGNTQAPRSKTPTGATPTKSRTATATRGAKHVPPAAPKPSGSSAFDSLELDGMELGGPEDQLRAPALQPMSTAASPDLDFEIDVGTAPPTKHGAGAMAPTRPSAPLAQPADADFDIDMSTSPPAKHAPAASASLGARAALGVAPAPAAPAAALDFGSLELDPDEETGIGAPPAPEPAKPPRSALDVPGVKPGTPTSPLTTSGGRAQAFAVAAPPISSEAAEHGIDLGMSLELDDFQPIAPVTAPVAPVTAPATSAIPPPASTPAAGAAGPASAPRSGRLSHNPFEGIARAPSGQPVPVTGLAAAFVTAPEPAPPAPAGEFKPPAVSFKAPGSTSAAGRDLDPFAGPTSLGPAPAAIPLGTLGTSPITTASPGPAPAQPAAAPAVPVLASQSIARLEGGAFATLVQMARDSGATDLHVAAARVTSVRTMGDLVPLQASAAALSASAVEELLLPLLDPAQRALLEKVGYVDLAIEAPGGGRLRANISRQQQGLKGTFRLAFATPPTLEQLGLPGELAKVVHHHQGLIVIAGPSGHGKTSTLAALVDIINSTRPHHILTIEDPIEIVYPRKQAVVSQRETGRHTQSFARGLKASLREDPDVIVIGELRDRESVEIALTAAETGHLVITTMSTPSAAKTIDRLVDMFPPDEQSQVRASIAGALRAIVAQRLLPRRGGGIVPAVELVTGVLPLAVLIREDKLFQLPSLMQRGRAFGMIRFDESLAEHVRAGRIEEEIALAYADSRKDLQASLKPTATAIPAPQKSGWGFGSKKDQR